MFYVSSINGAQSIYTGKSFRARGQGVSVTEVEPVLSLKGQGVDESRSRNPSKNPYKKIDEPQQRRERAMIASQIMSSPVISLFPSDLVAAGTKVFNEKRFRHIPVSNKEQKLVGIVSDRNFYSGLDQSKEIKNVMTAPVLSARP